MRYSIVTLIAMVLTSTFALAAATDQLAATKHNFAAGTYNLGAGNTVCQPCHTPHHAIVNAAISTRLWNHALSTASYTLYNSDLGGAYNGENPGTQGMDRVSRLCLGCHDGTVALDSFGMGADGSAAGHIGSVRFNANDVSNLGTDFRDDHPVGITAIALNPDGSPTSPYLKAATLTYNNPLDVTLGVRSAKIGVLSLASMNEGFVVGCKTCHNPHGTGTVNLSPNAHLLYTTPATLCNTCHYK